MTNFSESTDQDSGETRPNQRIHLSRRIILVVTLIFSLKQFASP